MGRVREWQEGGKAREMKVGDERETTGSWSESERREGVKWGGLDDVILDIRWNLHTVRARW